MSQRLSLWVGDVVVARLTSEGVKFMADDAQSPACRMAIMQDTEGNPIILHNGGAGAFGRSHHA